MSIIKPANPNSRIPAILQKNTKENIIFQLALTAVLVAGVLLKDAYDARQFDKQLEEDLATVTPIS